MKFTYRKVNHFEACHSMAFRDFAMSRHHHSSVQNVFIIPKRNPSPIKQSLPLSSSLQTLATTDLLSASADLLALDVARKWNRHTLCDVLCLAFAHSAPDEYSHANTYSNAQYPKSRNNSNAHHQVNGRTNVVYPSTERSIIQL